MKNKLSLLIVFLSVSLLSLNNAKAKGLNFLNSSLTVEQAIDKASQMDKILMIDVYAVWCGPCKALDKYVFPSYVLNELNDNYIGYKLNAETGEGPKYAKEWGVKGYPTILLVENGEIIAHKTGASKDPEDFVMMIKDLTDN